MSLLVSLLIAWSLKKGRPAGHDDPGSVVGDAELPVCGCGVLGEDQDCS